MLVLVPGLLTEMEYHGFPFVLLKCVMTKMFIEIVTTLEEEKLGLHFNH